jgi:cytochrome b
MAGKIRVWDPIVRVAHGALVASIAVAWTSGDEWPALHETAGYAAVGIVALRVVWGFVGSRHARFSDFVRGPSTVLAYLRDLAAGRERRHLGHNPAGGAMIVALLATILGLGLTGWLGTTDALWGSDWIEETHETLADGLIVLVALHIAGVLLASIREGENLIRAMVTGRKRLGQPAQ